MIKLNKILLNSFLHNFYLLTGLNTAIYSTSMEEIAAYPGNCKFCDAICKSPLNDICLNANKENFENCIQSSLSVKRCPFSLWDAVMPLNHNCKHIGYIMLGQARDSSVKTENVFTDDLKDKLSANGMNVELLIKDYNELPAMDLEHINACLEILNTCIDHLYQSNMIEDKSSFFSAEIEQYVDTHVSEKITVETLCKHFYLSKAHLYRLSKKNLGVDISTYIKNKRLELAKKLLKENEYTIAEIAEKVGIPDYNYFNKVFKKQFGISAAKFRNNDK